MASTRFREYRQYEQTRVEANDAVMGLLAGAGMGAHLLKLTEGSDRLLSEIFPKVDHIRRLDMKSAAATSILNSADVHLGAMVVPYVQGIHEDFLRKCLVLLQGAGRVPLNDKVEEIKAAGQHDAIERATGGTFTATERAQFTTLRRMRNCTIHAGGLADQSLINHLATWDIATEAAWTDRADRSPLTMKLGDKVEFGYGEILVALATTKALAREANDLMQPAISRPFWADLVVTDAAEEHPGVLGEPAGQRLRKIKGFARFNYQPIKLTDTEIEDAISRAI